MQKNRDGFAKTDPDAQVVERTPDQPYENAICKSRSGKNWRPPALEYARNLGIIQNSLFGVDIQPIAAEISKLRCFLTLVVDETIKRRQAQPRRGSPTQPGI
jgi:hypothetical protein